MTSPENVMRWYCGVTFILAAAAFVLKQLLLRDAARSRLSKAEQFVAPVEVAAWVFSWYGVSVSMVMANRWLFHDWEGRGFPFPVLTTVVHMWLKVVLSRSVLACQGRVPPRLDYATFIKTVVPIGLATSGDVLLSNVSFMYSTVTFYTIVKSGSLLWILLWAVVFKFEVLTFRILFVVSGLCAGLLLASMGETNFSLIGMFMILGASCLSGLRWALVQLLQAVEPSCADPLVVIHHIAPISALIMVPMSLFDILRKDIRGIELTHAAVVEVVTLVVGTGLFSFGLIFAEVKLLTITSSLTMGVFGMMKELVQIALAMLVFRDQLSVLNITGLVMAMGYTAVYKVVRQDQQEGQRDSGGKGTHRQGRGGGSSTANGDRKSRPRGSQLPYSAVSQQEVDEELRVFQYSTEMELEVELEEFSSYRAEQSEGQGLQP